MSSTLVDHVEVPSPTIFHPSLLVDSSLREKELEDRTIATLSEYITEYGLEKFIRRILPLLMHQFKDSLSTVVHEEYDFDTDSASNDAEECSPLLVSETWTTADNLDKPEEFYLMPFAAPVTFEGLERRPPGEGISSTIVDGVPVTEKVSATGYGTHTRWTYPNDEVNTVQVSTTPSQRTWRSVIGINKESEQPSSLSSSTFSSASPSASSTTSSVAVCASSPTETTLESGLKDTTSPSPSPFRSPSRKRSIDDVQAEDGEETARSPRLITRRRLSV